MRKVPLNPGWIGCSAFLSLVLLASLCSPSICGQNVPGQTTDVTINVRVTDERSGANLDQVRVELVLFPDEIVQQAFTDSSGRASFLNMQANKYIVRADVRGFEPTEVEIEALKGQKIFQVSIQMRPLDVDSKQLSGKISARELSIPESARNEFSKGVEFLNQKKDPEQSIKHFQNAIDAYPTYYEAYFLMGMAYLQAKQPKEGQSALQKAVDLNPKFLDPYFPLSELLIAGKQFDKAMPLLLAADQQDPQNWRWPYQLAMCYAKQRIWDKALNYGQMALARPDSPTKVHLLMADVYSNSGDPAKAVAELEQFEKLDPKSPYVARIELVLPVLRQRAASPQPSTGKQP